MLLALLAITSLAASPYEQLRQAVEGEQRLSPGDTAALIGLAGELGCVASHDPEDCAATRREPPGQDPVLELVPVPAVVLPAMAGQPASVLLPRFPYGLGEPVTPLLGPERIEGSLHSWVRVPLPEGAQATPGSGQALLLLGLDAPGPSVQPFVEPPGPPPVDALLPGVDAEAWPAQLASYTRLQVTLPTRLMALRVEDGDRTLADHAWAEDPPELRGQSLVEPAWGDRAVQRLSLATGVCMRAYYAEQLSRPSSAPPVLPIDLSPPRLALQVDPLGQVMDAVALDAPWDQPEPSGCLRANARLLPASEAGEAVTVLPLILQRSTPADATDRSPR
jgi:hypothetical protein